MPAVVRISWPSKPLWANRRVHWAARSRSVAAYRREAFAEARRAGVKPDLSASLVFRFYPPDRRKRDLHNMPHTMKAAIDGIADAMGCDDAGFRCAWPSEFCDPVKGGAVEIEVSE